MFEMYKKEKNGFEIKWIIEIFFITYVRIGLK
jgi:hypothetical protein